MTPAIAERLGDSGRRPLEDGHCRLRRHVARAETCPTRRQHELGLVRELGDRVSDRVALVGNDPAGDLVALSGEQLVEQVSAAVLTVTLRDAVGDGEDSCSHSIGSFVFSTRCTSVIAMSVSIALAMS